MILNYKNTDALSFLKSIKSNTVSLILTDPPYLISHKDGQKIDPEKDYAPVTGPRINGAGLRIRRNINFGDWDHPDSFSRIYFNEVMKQFFRVLKQGGTCIVFYDFWKMNELKEDLMEKGFKQPRIIEWIKKNPPPINSKRNYLNNHREMAISVVKGKKPTFNSSYDFGIYNYPSCNGSSTARFHPTQKPMKLMGELIRKHSNKNEIVLDSFGGSATTLLAALRLKRRAFGCEKDKAFFTKGLKRLKDYLNLLKSSKNNSE